MATRHKESPPTQLALNGLESETGAAPLIEAEFPAAMDAPTPPTVETTRYDEAPDIRRLVHLGFPEGGAANRVVKALCRKGGRVVLDRQVV